MSASHENKRRPLWAVGRESNAVDPELRLESIKLDLLGMVVDGLHGECAYCEAMFLLKKHFNIQEKCVNESVNTKPSVGKAQ